jgi:hypothetical protein
VVVVTPGAGEVGILAVVVEDIRAGDSNPRASSLTKIEGRFRPMTLRS